VKTIQGELLNIDGYGLLKILILLCEEQQRPSKELEENSDVATGIKLPEQEEEEGILLNLSSDTNIVYRSHQRQTISLCNLINVETGTPAK
jgi:hypothetical protein